MTIKTVKITCDSSYLLSALDVLEGSLEVVKSRFDSVHSLLEFMGIDFETVSTATAGECGILLKTSDSFRDFVAALRAGNID